MAAGSRGLRPHLRDRLSAAPGGRHPLPLPQGALQVRARPERYHEGFCWLWLVFDLPHQPQAVYTLVGLSEIRASP